MSTTTKLSPIPLVYAIRHIPTGHFLPMSFTRGHRHSHDEPTPNCVPRLFPTKQSAQSALTQWLRGKWQNTISMESEGWEYPSYPVQELEVRPVLSRKAKEMEIVVMHIEEATGEATCHV